MRTSLKLVVLATCLLGPGCQFACTVARNIVHEPLLACDEKATKHRCRKLGKQAWNEMVRQYGDAFSCDYREGFVDGFVDYLYYGGCNGGPAGSGGCTGGHCGAANTANATPAANPVAPGENVEYPVCPPVPPERYRRKRYMTPEGCAAVEDWFAGFRHGAATAMASGLRNLVVIPVQCPPVFGPDDGGPLPAATRPSSTPAKDSGTTMPPTDEITPPGSAGTLPPPRPNVEANPMPVTPPPGR
jgi:hypothetical protein